MMYSSKSLRDTRDNFITLGQSDSLMLKERMQNLREQMIDLYTTISDVIDADSIIKYNKLLDKNLTAIINTNKESADMLGQHLHRHSMPGGELSALLHLTNGINRSHHAIAQALRGIYSEKKK